MSLSQNQAQLLKWTTEEIKKRMESEFFGDITILMRNGVPDFMDFRERIKKPKLSSEPDKLDPSMG